MFNKKFVNSTLTTEGTSTQDFKECIKNIDKTVAVMFPCPTNTTEFFIAIGNLKKFKTLGTAGVYVEVLKSALPVIRFLI